MQRGAATWVRIRALCTCLIMGLSLMAAPAIEAAKHGPGALAAEADHRAFHADHGHSHDGPGANQPGHHDASDHDHVGAALLAASGPDFHPAPQQTLCPESHLAGSTICDGPRRPPRLTVA
jgi:hypothetical protein